MAIDLEPVVDDRADDLVHGRTQSNSMVWNAVKSVLNPIASLRLTVTLFALSILLIFVGTLAQVDKDIWEVVGTYFRCWFAWVPVQTLIPPSFVIPHEIRDSSGAIKETVYWFMGLVPFGTWKGNSVPEWMGFWIPGGKLLGLLLAANLLAAHIVRFKAQAKGTKLWLGIGALAVGCVVTWMIIEVASNSKSFQTDPWIRYSTLWIGIKGLLVLLTLGAAFGCYRVLAMWYGKKRVLTPSENLGYRMMFRTTALATVGLFSLTSWLLGSDFHPGDPSLRILWQLMQGMAAAALLLVGCWIVFGKRSGIVLLHGGVGLMMFYELHVAMTAIETQMMLEEGETTNFVQDIRTYELAVIDKSKAGEESVTAIPRWMIVSDKQLDLPNLPFQITVGEVMPNSELRAAQPDEKNPATTGHGTKWIPVSRRPGSGTDMGGKIDMASAYVTLTNKSTKEKIGTHLTSMMLSLVNEADPISVDGKPYELALRFKRYYKPYQFTLKDVRKDDYIGTSTPRHYASTVHIVEPKHKVDETKTIWMNNPLRFEDETFYQSNYSREAGSGAEHTTLSVVTNSGWMMPYVACMLVAVGMATHFLIVLVRFLNRGDRTQSAVVVPSAVRLNIKAAKGAEEPPKNERPFDKVSVIAAAAVVVAAGIYILIKATPPAQKDLTYDLYQAGQIPVVQDGRVKPLDSAAYTALLTISGRSFVEVGEGADKKKIPATQWFLDVISFNPEAQDYHVFKVENLEVQETIGVKKREGLRYSRREILKKEREFKHQVDLARKAAKTDPRSLSVYQRKMIELDDKVTTFDVLQYAFGLHHRIPFDEPKELFNSMRDTIFMERRLTEEGRPLFAIPAKTSEDKWQTYTGAWLRDLIETQFQNKPADPLVTAWKSIISTYAESSSSVKDSRKETARPKDFNRAVSDYLKLLDKDPPSEINMSKIRFEAFFNYFQPFTQADRLYVLAFVIGACGWLGWTAGFNRVGFWLLMSTFLLHSFALVSRMIISGRPPVTNLYSSAVFIGWACVLLGLIMECVYRIGIGNLIAAVAGYATLLIADGLSMGGDTFTVLQAVLDTQFWLATHVTTITLGYATTYLAGLLGVVYVLRGVFTPSLDPWTRRELYRMIYGTLCFSIFFSFVGTVLGGLWADDSWGRFWGWDPKENGALIIVLWNALVLHARWAGIVKERGLAVLAIGGNIFVSWSWWGVNELGAGLHSYGFTEGTVVALGVFVLSQLVLIGIGLIPKKKWWSFRQAAV